MSDLQEREGNLKNRNCRNRMMFAAVCALMLAVAAAGCGKEEEGLQIEAIENGQEDTGNDAAENAGQEDIGNDGTENAGQEDAGSDVTENVGQEDAGNDAAEKTGLTDEEQGGGGEDNAAPSVGNTEIEGDVRSLSADSFVICKHETWSEDGASFATAAAPGYEKEEDMITVRVAENCVYEYRTVKNGGVSPEDVSTREGMFADLKERMSITINGNWQDDGSFLADSIVMMEFV